MLEQLIPVVLSGLFGGGGSSSPPPDASGVASSASQNVPVQENPVSGTARDALQAGVTGAMGMGDRVLNGMVGGMTNRAFLERSFPELNPWELAGVSATQPGVQSGQQETQKEIVKDQLANQREMQDEQIEFGKFQAAVSERIAAMQAAASIESAGISAAPGMIQAGIAQQMQFFNEMLSQAQAGKATAEQFLAEGRNARERLSHAAELTLGLMTGRRIGSAGGSPQQESMAATIGAGLGKIGNLFSRRGQPGGAGAASSPSAPPSSSRPPGASDPGRRQYDGYSVIE
jgi:hypothetical protein